MKNILIIMVIICLSSGCKKSFLDVEDNSVVLAEQYVKDLSTSKHYLNGIYILLGRDFFNRYHQIYPDLAADNIKPANGKSSLLNIYNWNQQQSETGGFNMNDVWRNGYQIARSCSFLQEKLNTLRSENPAIAEEIEAETLTIRALVHFTMLQFFAQPYSFTTDHSHAGIPYVTASDWNIPVPRSSVNEAYALIIADLEKAIGLFKGNIISSREMNIQAAKALLARTYLFKEDWVKAKSLATEVVNVVPIMTGSSYPSKLFTTQETEALFQLVPSSTVSAVGGSYNTNFQGREFNNGSSTNFNATKDIATLFKVTGDVRSVWIRTGSGNVETIVKYPTGVIPGFNPVSNSYYPTLLRSSEMYLTIAEAAAHLGETSVAVQYLDAIRKRANPSASSTTATGNALLEIIYDERRKELAFEGLRLFDLQRWKRPINRVDPTTPTVAQLPYPHPRRISPIPTLDAQSIGQNPGY